MYRSASVWSPRRALVRRLTGVGGIAGRKGFVMEARRVLIVEDDAMTRLLLVDVLAEGGHVVCGAVSTEAEAVAAARRLQPDLVIIDARLGRGSGPAAMREILRLGFVPHVFISADALVSDDLHAAAVSLRKPFDADALTAAIAQAVEG